MKFDGLVVKKGYPWYTYPKVLIILGSLMGFSSQSTSPRTIKIVQETIQQA